MNSLTASASLRDSVGYSGSLPTSSDIRHDLSHLAPFAISTTTPILGSSSSIKLPSIGD